MTEVLLDTDILSYFFRGHAQVVAHAENYLQTHPRLNISLISYYEILSGLMFKSATSQLQRFQRFSAENRILIPDQSAMQHAAEAYACTRQQGEAVDDMALLIAGIALSHHMPLVTNNTRHFERIPGLQLHNWCLDDLGAS